MITNTWALCGNWEMQLKGKETDKEIKSRKLYEIYKS